MKQFFKTTLLAASVAALCGTATAGNVSVTKQVHSSEGLSGVTANQTSNAITYVLAAAYREGDKITFTFPTDTLVATTFPTVINMEPVNSAVEANAIAGLTLGLLNSDASSVTYRVTKLTLPNNAATPAVEWQNGSTLGGTVNLGTIGYKPASLTSAPVTVTVSSQTAVGDVLDNGGTRTATVAEAKTQFGSAAVNSKFDAVIDVSSARKAFVGGGSDSYAWTITNPDTTGWLNLATVNASGGTVATLYGEAGKMTGLKADNFAAGGAKVFTADAAKLAVTFAGMATNDTVTFTPPGDVVLEAQSFTTDLVYNYASAANVAGTKSIATGLASGEWTLNGATVNIPYMPYSANASQIIYVSNEGAQAGDVLVTAFDDKGNSYDLGKVGVANAKTVTKLTTAITQAAQAKGFTAGKLSLTITVNAPSDDITVYASYNAGSVRGFVNTDQYKGK